MACITFGAMRVDKQSLTLTCWLLAVMICSVPVSKIMDFNWSRLFGIYRCFMLTIRHMSSVANSSINVQSCDATLTVGADLNRRCLHTASPQSKVPNQHLMSKSHRSPEHWYSCWQRMVYVGRSAWTSDMYQRVSSSWSPWSYSYDPTFGISRGPCLSYSLICISSGFMRLMTVRYFCHFMYCTDHYCQQSHKLHCLLNNIY
jgi:hypothetical protein